MATYDDFAKLDIRAGTILTAREFREARRPAYQLTIDFGVEIGVKKSSAQITDHYQPNDLVGRQIIAVVNFPPKQIARFFSEVLVLGLSDADGTIVLVEPDQSVPDGAKLS